MSFARQRAETIHLRTSSRSFVIHRFHIWKRRVHAFSVPTFILQNITIHFTYIWEMIVRSILGWMRPLVFVSELYPGQVGSGVVVLNSRPAEVTLTPLLTDAAVLWRSSCILESGYEGSKYLGKKFKKHYFMITVPTTSVLVHKTTQNTIATA